jgi:hypothetical protein
MLELIFGLLVLGFIALLAIPCILAFGALVLVAKVVLGLLLLPFKLIAYGFGGLFEAAGFVLGAILKFLLGFVVFSVLFVVGLALLIVPLVPLAPILLAAALGWLLYRILRRPPQAAT